MTSRVEYRPISQDTAMKVAAKICAAFGLPVVRVRCEGRQGAILGSYQRDGHIVRLNGKRGQTAETLLHEIAHHAVYEKRSHWQKALGYIPPDHGKDFRRRHTEIIDLFLARRDIAELTPRRLNPEPLETLAALATLAALMLLGAILHKKSRKAQL